MSLLNLYPYQKSLILDQSRFIVAMMARQTGKSFGAACKIVLSCRRKPQTSWFIISGGERQTKDLMQKVKLHAQITNETLKILEKGYNYVNEFGEREEYKILSANFRNGSRIIALPANPDTVRGYSGNVYFDEFSAQKNSREMWAAVFPIISRGQYKMMITFTPKGKLNMAYEVWNNEIFNHHRTDIYEAVKLGCPHDIDLLRAAIDDPELWSQEYELEFLDEATAYIPYELIIGAQDDKAGIPYLKKSGPFFVGMDIGRRRNLSIIWVLELVEDVLWTREVIELKKATFSVQDAELDRVINQYNPTRVCMDQSGMGEKPVEDAKFKYGDHKIEGILFSAPTKLDMAGQVRKLFENRTIRIPVDRNIRDDIHSVKKTVTIAGNIRFDAERTDDSHADRFWSLALATHAAGRTHPAVCLSSEQIDYNEYKGPVEHRSMKEWKPNNRPSLGNVASRFNNKNRLIIGRR